MTVSVIIPTWNREHTLGRAIRSALSQTVPVLEILVCDDGSTDSSRKILDAFADERIVWVEGSHVGLPAVPRNRGLALARGEWVAFLDSDDEWLPHKLEIQLAALAQSQAEAVCSNAFRILSLKAKSHSTFFSKGPSKDITLDDLLETNTVICSSCVIRREMLIMMEGFPENPRLKAIEDYALWIRVACFSPIHYLAEPTVNYWDNPQESVRQDDVPPLEQRLRILQDANQWVARHKWQLNWNSKQKIKRSLNIASRTSNRNTLRTAKKFFVSILKRL